MSRSGLPALQKHFISVYTRTYTHLRAACDENVFIPVAALHSAQTLHETLSYSSEYGKSNHFYSTFTMLFVLKIQCVIFLKDLLT